MGLLDTKLFFELIESLHELTFSSPESAAQSTVKSLFRWAQPLAVFVKIEYSGGIIMDSSEGDPAHLKMICDSYEQLRRLKARACRLDMDNAERTIVWAAGIKTLPGD